MDLLNGQGATNLISLALVVITGVYVYLTRQIAVTNQKQIEPSREQFLATIRPFVVARISIRHTVFLSLEIENIGKTPAQDLKLEISKPFHQFAKSDAGSNIQTFEAFNRSIPTFSPSELFRFDLSQGFNLNKEHDGKLLTPMQFDVTASYKSDFDIYNETYHIDLLPYFHTHTPRSASEYLEKIESHLNVIARKK